MRPLSRGLVALACLFAFTACKGPAALEYQSRQFERGYEGCKPETENCTFLKLSYPDFSRGPNPKGLQAIQQRVLYFSIAPTGEKKATSLESFAKDFFADFQAFRQQFPNAPQVWSLERKVEVLVNDPKILSLSFDEFQFLGGAHPNSSRSLSSLNPETGAPYTLGDLLKPGYAEKLNTLGEKQFRAVRQIPAGQSLEDAGFDFKGGGFQLNDNFAAGQEGLIFYFNAYEIAAYVYGPTEVVIGYALLRDLAKSDGPLKGLLK